MKQLRILSSLPKENKDSTQPERFKAYKRMPFTPDKLSRPLIPKLLLYTPQHKIRMRKIASRQIEDHFQNRHHRYKSKENHHSSCFKVRAKKLQERNQNENETFWVDRLQRRTQGLRQLHEHYLHDVSTQLDRRMEWTETETDWGRQQKIINEYNIIYEYKQYSLPIQYMYTK